MRLDEIELREYAFGTNKGEFNDGKIGYNSTKKALYLVSPLGTELNLVCIQYFNGNCVFTTTKSQDVDKIITGSIETLLKPDSIAKALSDLDLASDMLKQVMRKYHSRLPTIRFTTFDETNARKMRIALEKPVLKGLLTRYNYSFIETVVQDGAILEVYSREQ